MRCGSDTKSLHSDLIVMFNSLKMLVLSSLVLLTDYIFLFDNLRVTTLFCCLLVLYYFVVVNPVAIKHCKHICLDDDTSAVVNIALLFIVYLLSVDLLRGRDIFESIVGSVSAIVMVALLPIFENRRGQFNVIRQFKWLMIVSMLFSLAQILGKDIILVNIFPGFGPLQPERVVEEFGNKYSRTMGATSNIIAFSSQLTIFVIISYTTWIRSRRPMAVIGVIVALFFLITTQTRAAILAIVPSIIITQSLLARLRLQEMVRVFLFIAVLAFGYWFLSDLVLSHMAYLDKEIDHGDTHRFWVNWYMSIGVINESPLFGIAREAAWDLYLKYGDLRIYSYNPNISVPTHHNQLGYYLRYYGIVGAGLLCCLYALIFRKILRSKSFFVGVALGSIFLVDLIYSMAHNNKLLGSPLLWILLSLASLSPTKERELLW